MAEDHAVTHLYRKVVSPSIKFKTEEWSKQQHPRHGNYYGLSPTVRRRLVSSSRNTYSAPAGRVQNQLSIQNKQSVDDGVDIQQGNYNFQPTIAFKTTSLPAMPLSKKYSPSLAGTVRSIPVSTSRYSAVTLPDRWANENPRILFTSQRQRWETEENARTQSRRLKRTSEIVAHRMDKHYYMSGSSIPVHGRWQVDTSDLLRLKLLAHHKQLAQYNKIKNSDSNFLDPRESPGGQMSTPTPGGRGRRRESGAISSELESRSGTEGAWAETGSDGSSVDEFDSISMRGHQADLRERKRRENEQFQNGNLQLHKDHTDNKIVTRTLEITRHEKNESVLMNGQLSEETKSIGSENEIQDRISKEKVKENENNQLLEAGNVKENEITEKESKANKREKKSVEISEKDKKTAISKSPKKGRIRFKDDVKLKHGVDVEQGKEVDGEKHENKYLNEWLGIKKKEVDERYKPGKTATKQFLKSLSNELRVRLFTRVKRRRWSSRIFISSDPVQAKKEAGRFSEIFLTELSTIRPLDTDASEDGGAAKFGILTAKQRTAFKSMFDEVDKDKNGSVTLEELKLRMMPAISRGDIKHFVQVFDVNKDKTIDGREFSVICALNDRLAVSRTETAEGSIALNLEKLAQQIVIFKEMFKVMDEDDDNRLDANEVLIMVSAAMTTELGSDLEIARTVLEGARDEFGYIDFVGFLCYIPFFAKLLKAIMANPLTIAQIEQARERVNQKDITFKPKQPKSQPKSWEAF